MGDEQPTNGSIIRWRDLDAHREAEAQARYALDIAWGERYKCLEDRVNSIESVLDQLRGARALLTFVGGASLLSAIASIIAMAVALR